jgi:hypothetical protein
MEFQMKKSIIIIIMFSTIYLSNSQDSSSVWLTNYDPINIELINNMGFKTLFNLWDRAKEKLQKTFKFEKAAMTIDSTRIIDDRVLSLRKILKKETLQVCVHVTSVMYDHDFIVNFVRPYPNPENKKWEIEYCNIGSNDE